MQKLELLAPAKNLDGARAAVDFGADALYIGGAKFGARYAAGNSCDDIARVVEYAHSYGVRVHTTLNTVLFENELQAAEAQARELIATGIDALIVQDMAYTRMGLHIELHASTQTCNNSAERVKFLGEAGFSRAVLERGLSLREIEQIRAATNIELEAFIHGAICVGHSGQCYLSRSSSHRSGNRGECSQPCRLSYDLCDDTGRKILSNKHLLSVKDMDLSNHIGRLIDAGICSFKVEGRLKEIGYAKNIVAHYRQIIDRHIADRKGFARSSDGRTKFDFEPNPTKTFSRSGSSYVIDGQRTELATFDSPKARGESLGRIISSSNGAIRIEGAPTLTAGDGICFVRNSELVGTNINSVQGSTIYPNRTEGLTKGVEVWRNFDKAFSDALERSRTRRAIEVEAQISLTENNVTVKYKDSYSYGTEQTLEGTFEPSKNSDRQREMIQTQLKKSGDTIFEVTKVEIIGEPFFIASSQLAALRRDALNTLTQSRIAALPKARIFTENLAARYPYTEVAAEGNVTNSVSRQFYLDHGAKTIAPALELRDNLQGERVLHSSYCIRQEIGECLRRGSKLRDPLFITRGEQRYKLEFDCAKCKMNIIKV